MRFAYTYRSSDGQRHAAEIEAESRDAAFAAIRRELGVKPIKVVAAEGRDGAPRAARASAAPRGGIWRAAILAATVLAVLGGARWWARRAGDAAPYQVMTPQGPVTCTVAAPLSRQAIPGDRQRVEAAVAQERDPPVLAHAAERWLARYAEPGRAAGGRDGPRPSREEFEAALREPIRVASTDFTEVVDLKRIVAGMKREMRAYLAGGGDVDGYLAELEKRQRLEASYRRSAEEKVAALLKDPKAAYAYWLKANAQLQSMGIWPIPLPDPLRAYQTGLDIEE